MKFLGRLRTIQSIDQLSKVTSFTYDAGGNQLSVRDPNSVGQDAVYDALGRAGLTTDTAGATTKIATMAQPPSLILLLASCSR